MKKKKSVMGRTPLPEGEVKKRVLLFIKQDVIDAWGGEAKLKEKLIEFAEAKKPGK